MEKHVGVLKVLPYTINPEPYSSSNLGPALGLWGPGLGHSCSTRAQCRHIHTYIHTYLPTYLPTCIHAYMHIHACTHTCIHYIALHYTTLHCMHTCIHAYTHARAHTHICIHAYTHTLHYTTLHCIAMHCIACIHACMCLRLCVFALVPEVCRCCRPTPLDVEDRHAAGASL